MNLKELVQEINSALDYNPDIKAYTDQVVRVVNRHYLQLSGQYPWKFMQKTDDIILRPDVSGSADNVLKVNTITDNTESRRVTFAGTKRVVPNKQMEGQHLVLNIETAEDLDAGAMSTGSYAVDDEGAAGFGQDFLITRSVLGSSSTTLASKEPTYAAGEAIDGTDATRSDDTVAAGPVEPSEYYNPSGTANFNNDAYLNLA